MKIKKIKEGRDKMHKLSYLVALLLLSFVGCMQESNITGPVNNVNNNQSKTIIMLPEKADMSIESSYSTSGDINGNSGGDIHLIKSYLAANGQTVTIDCQLTIPADNDAFSDVRDITMEVSDQAGVDFYPSMTFDQPVILNYTITGLDLSNVNPEDVGFFYVAPDGNLIPAENEGVIVDLNSGTLEVINAQLPHFSRWAYAR